MSKSEFKDLTLDNAGGGAAQELFQRELENVLANIADVETNPDAKRSITLTFTFDPFPDRKGASIDIKATSKLAPAKSAVGLVWVARDKSNLVALTQNPEQGDLLAQGEQEPDIVSIDRTGTDVDGS